MAMGIIELAKYLIQFVLLLVGKHFETDAEKKKIKGEAADAVYVGIKTRDRSQITAGFSRVKNNK